MKYFFVTLQVEKNDSAHIMDIFHTFHVVEREMISYKNNLSFFNIGGEVYSKRIQKLFLES
jgi:hypothetical protein